MIIKNKNIFSLLSKYNNKIAVKDKILGKISYKKLNKDVDKLKPYFSSKNLILILANNSYEFIVFYVASIKFNQLVLLSNPDFGETEISKIIKKYQPKYILAKNKFGFLKKYKNLMNFYSYNFYNKISDLKFEIDNELSCLLSTSGTTGDVKYAKISIENLLDNTKKISNVLKINSKDVTITTMPPYYSYALSVINTHLFKGASIILNNYSIIDRNFWKLFEKFKPNNLNGVPYIYEILKKINFQKMNIKSLKYMTQAGGKMDERIKDFFIDICNKKKIQLYIMYGQTEASPRMAILPWRLLNKFPNSVGFPLEGSKVQIEKKFKFKKKMYGEIVYYGKNVFQGYSKNYKDLINKNSENGKLNTGDLGYLGKNGLIYITGRKKRILKIFGIRISLDDVENELKKDNIESICLGDDKKLKISYKSKINKENLIQKIKNITRLPRNFIEVTNIKRINRNEVGKIIYK